MFSHGKEKNENFDIVETLKMLEAKANSPYDISIIVLSSAELKEEACYKANLNKLEVILETLPNDSFKSWMAGRIALAAKTMDDKNTLTKWLPKLKEILNECKEKNKEDASSAWAWGYRAALDANEYKESRENMLSAARSISKPADALWAYVMNIQAAAHMQDGQTYNQILDEMKTLTRKSSVGEALSEIPSNDWQAWALTIVSSAAATINDKDLVHELEQPTRNALQEACKLNLMANAMMAQINQKKIDAQMKNSLSMKGVS
jgi:hypothetical protein